MVVLTLACTSSCSSAPPLQTQDDFFKPLDRRTKSAKPSPEVQIHAEMPRTDVKVSREPSHQQAEVDSLKNENRMLRDSLGRMLDYASQIKRQALAKQSRETAKPVYTVQIGAFGRSKAQHALRLQKNAQERFANQVVLNNYDSAHKLYRVSVGEFETREDASRLRNELIRRFPQEYSQCWVNNFLK